MSNPWADIDTPKQDFNVRLVSSRHPLRLYWGRDIAGNYLFVLEKVSPWSKDHPIASSLAGIAISFRTIASRSIMVLALNRVEDWELFYTLCSDLVQFTANSVTENEGCGLFVRRLAKWQDFLKRKKLGILKPEAIKGLIGELLFMSEKVAPAFGWGDAVSFWKGPEDAPQDFAVNDVAVEVKCQSGGSLPTVRISSLEQLNPQLPKAFLAVYTLASANSEEIAGFTLNTVVLEILRSLDGSPDLVRERFEDLVFEAGYVQLEEYDRYRFTKVSEVCFEVRPGFPRIEPQWVPAGVEKLAYSIRLDACIPFAGHPDWW